MTLSLDPLERDILVRLEIRGAAYLAAPDRQAAAVRLRERGLIRLQEGEGRDAGLLIATLPPKPGGRTGGGSDAA